MKRIEMVANLNKLLTMNKLQSLFVTKGTVGVNRDCLDLKNETGDSLKHIEKIELDLKQTL